MKKFHILAYLYGEAGSTVALIQIDQSAATAINAALTTSRQFGKDFACFASMQLSGNLIPIHFFEEIPETYKDTLGDCWKLLDAPSLLNDFDAQAFIQAAKQENFWRETDCTGTIVSDAGITFIGNDAGSPEESHTGSLAKLLLPLIQS